MRRPKLGIIEVKSEQVTAMVARFKAFATEEDFKVLSSIVETHELATEILRDRHATLRRMRRLFGIDKTEKTAAIRAAETAKGKSTGLAMALALDGTEGSSETNAACEATTCETPTPASEAATGAEVAPDEPSEKRKGHGRVPASAYLDAAHVEVPHESLRRGDPCPQCPKGTVYPLRSTPIVRIVGQAPLAAICWDCERFRCGSCGSVFTARLPPAAQGQKCDETAVSMLAVLHYGTGMPFYRLDRLQANLSTPLAASTQYEVIAERIPQVEPVYNELVRLGAQAELVHNDDTHARILSLMGKRRTALVESAKLESPERTGLFTTAIVAILASLGAIALFFTGRKHAGENLDAVLEQRDPALAPPLLMSDALSRNVPKGHDVVESNCLAHGRRKVVDEVDDFAAHCLQFLDKLGLVYKLDKECRQQRVSDEQRLQAHQQHSAPIMEALQKWMAEQLTSKVIEPNSGLGEAFTYMLKRWDKLTVFLRVPGAPLDNNLCERTLKLAIKLRKASLFYRTERGARVGDIYMSLIYTAELHGQNPFEYLTELQRHHKAVAQTPGDWLPWNYKATLERIRRPSCIAA